MTLRQLLLKKGFKRIKLQRTITNHLEMAASINGVNGRFILDTGASSSCVDFEAAQRFKLLAEDSDIKAAGAGASDMLTQLSSKNTIIIGKWSYKKLALVLFDMVHVNTALVTHNAEPVDGIIGADILKKGKGVIDYKGMCLYLK